MYDWWEKKFFRVAAYIGFAVVSFFIFFLWTFPTDRVGDIAANQIEAALDYEYDVSITDMGFWRLTGIQARGIRLQERAGGDQSADEDARGMTIRLERLAGRFSPLRSLLNRGPTASFQVDVGGRETVRGTFAQSGPEQLVTVSMNSLDLQQSTLISSLLGVRILGDLDGDIDLTINPATGLATGGHVSLTGQQITLGQTTLEMDMIPFLTELELPTTSFGNLDVHLDFEETEQGSRVNFEQFTIRGRDIQADVWGHIDLNPRGGQPDLKMRLQFNQEYVTEHGLAPYLNVSDVRDGELQTDDGHWYGFEMSGSFDNVDFGGSTDAAQGPGASGDEE